METWHLHRAAAESGAHRELVRFLYQERGDFQYRRKPGVDSVS